MLLSLRFLMVFVLCLSCKSAQKKEDTRPPTQPETDSRLFPYHASSSIASALRDCMMKCLLGKICSQKQAPTLNDVLDRILVSNQEDGKIFEEFFTKIPQEALDDFLVLFKNVTVIVIDEFENHEGGFVSGIFLFLTKNIFSKPKSFLLAEKQDISQGQRI